VGSKLDLLNAAGRFLLLFPVVHVCVYVRACVRYRFFWQSNMKFDVILTRANCPHSTQTGRDTERNRDREKTERQRERDRQQERKITTKNIGFFLCSRWQRGGRHVYHYCKGHERNLHGRQRWKDEIILYYTRKNILAQVGFFYKSVTDYNTQYVKQEYK